MNAETAYLFRHAVLRDAAYGLQLPGDRAHLHRLALDILEEVFGEEPPGSMAPDLAGHCAMGAVDTDAGLRDGLGRKEVRYLNLAGEYAGDRYRNAVALVPVVGSDRSPVPAIVSITPVVGSTRRMRWLPMSAM